MNCKNATELLSDYVSGQLDRALTVSLENHLATCANCSKEVAGLRWAWSLLDETPSVETPAYFHENLMSRIAAETTNAEEAAARKRAVWDWRTWFAPRSLAYVTACLALALATLGGLHAARASFDPIGPILHLFSRPAPPVLDLKTHYYDWVPDAQGHGALEIRLQAQPKADGTLNTLHYRLTLPGQVSSNAHDLDATVYSDKETMLRIPLAAPPAENTVNISVSAPDAGNETKTLSVQPLMPSTDPKSTNEAPSH